MTERAGAAPALFKGGMIRARLLGARQEEVLPQGAANCGQGLEEAGGALGTGACQPCVRLLSCVAVSLPARDRGGWRRLRRGGKGREGKEGALRGEQRCRREVVRAVLSVLPGSFPEPALDSHSHSHGLVFAALKH